MHIYICLHISRFLRVSCQSWFWLKEQREPAITIFVHAWVSILVAIEGRGIIAATRFRIKRGWLRSVPWKLLSTCIMTPGVFLGTTSLLFLGKTSKGVKVPTGFHGPYEWWSIWPSLVLRWPLSTTQLLEAPSAPKMWSPQQDGVTKLREGKGEANLSRFPQKMMFKKMALVGECSPHITRWPYFSWWFRNSHTTFDWIY